VERDLGKRGASLRLSKLVRVQRCENNGGGNWGEEGGEQRREVKTRTLEGEG